MSAGGAGPGSEGTRVADGLVAVDRVTERRDAGIVATYTVTTENERPVAVHVENDLPGESTEGTGFHPSREPRWWVVEESRLGFKDTVGSTAPATFEFGLAIEGGFGDDVSLPDPEIVHAEPVGVAPEGDRMVFPDADAEEDAVAPSDSRGAADAERGGGLLSGVRSAVFGGDDDEVVRASDLDPDAMVVSRGETTPGGGRDPTQPHDENPTLTPVVAPVSETEDAAFSALPAADEGEGDRNAAPAADGAASETPVEDDGAGGEVLAALLADLQSDAARERLRAELGVDELERTREAVEDLREEVSALRADLEATADAGETTAARVADLCRAVDGLAAELDHDVPNLTAADAETGSTERRRP
ncbi:hypothetical protein N0B31_08200 [Salinirubellus salinus]|uniref:Uncharacterized protein n=1 Tax=Salinirubellus salinus TaxID=1364945 RepID=A0A9E7U6A1_9EURY|nr:hypothetical protein [Salinirubellus salinus]UWM56265.1 hypothetical protein N0B31_08200 [Salinirubellus salinus]